MAVRPCCAICSATTPDTIGLLCPACARLIARGGRHAPGIVTSRTPADAAEGWVIDAWGQLHPIGARCAIGRDPQSNDLVIADLGVSGTHAELRRDRDRWVMRDLGSGNGTGLGDQPRARVVEPGHRDRVWFGGIAFYLWADRTPPAREVPPPEVSTVIPDSPGFTLTAEGVGDLIIRPVRGHPLTSAPGELEYHGHGDVRVRRAALPRLQFQLLRLLCDVAADAGDDRTACVGSHELLAQLPFQTHRPELTHVRQVVSTLRATLERVGVPGGGSVGTDALIQAREGQGYRVTWRVRRLGTAAR
ncbi:MAG TPA: FHA domain-containing protein [Kofleriaceae bacterium]|jgi:hypothetical protein|nr:FHA domain-containing protein [Kofleriaceae bacterium]